MFRKNALKMFIFSLCAMLVASIFSFNGNVAKADTLEISVPRGYEFEYVLGEDFNGVANSEVVVKVNETTVYTGGKLENNLDGAIASANYSNKKFTAKFTKNDEYQVVISKSDNSVSESFTLLVTTDLDKLGKLSYSDDVEKIVNFAKKVKEGNNLLKAGDDYTVASFE